MSGYGSRHCSTWLFQSNISQASILEELEHSFCALIFLKQIDYFFFVKSTGNFGAQGRNRASTFWYCPQTFFIFPFCEIMYSHIIIQCIFCHQMSCIFFDNWWRYQYNKIKIKISLYFFIIRRSCSILATSFFRFIMLLPEIDKKNHLLRIKRNISNEKH